MTKKIVTELSFMDIAIVSGLALGIDTIAHKTAIKCKLPTIAVLGSGLDDIYPRHNRDLARQMEEDNLIISEYPPNTPPISIHFPQRNRIISGLSIATIVIEAPEKSGALITARFALEQGKEIFVVPGDIDRINSIGTLKLLQDGGAYPISSGIEVAGILQGACGRKKTKQTQMEYENHDYPKTGKTKRSTEKERVEYNLSSQQKKILSTISKNISTPFSSIQKKTDMEVKSILSCLTMLEIYGLIAEKGEGYIRKA